MKKNVTYSQYITGELSKACRTFVSTDGELYVPEVYVPYFLFGNTSIKTAKGKVLCPLKMPALAKAFASLYSSKTAVVYEYGKRRGFFQPVTKYVPTSLLKTVAGEIEETLPLEDFDKVCNDIRKSCCRTVDVSELKAVDYSYEETESVLCKVWEAMAIAKAS